jgi:dTDP-4-dehydrorhamnose reductase
MRFAVLGAAGQLGCELCARLPGEVIAVGRTHIDLARPDAIHATVAALGVDAFINCAAYNLVDRAESDPEAAFAVNAWGVRALARACRAANVKLVHFSTDYVFGIDSSRTEPYGENDPPGPLGVYGLSKLSGEYLCRAECPDALVIRTCGLYGTAGSGGKGGNFVETMLRLAGEGKPIRVVNDQHCTPSYTVDVAEATTALVGVGATGLFHVTNAGSCTWYELAAETFRQSGLKPSLTPISSSEYESAARRPSFSVLSTAKAAAAGIAVLRGWKSALDSYLLERRTRALTQETHSL